MSKKALSPELQDQLNKLAALPDDQIDTVDIPEAPAEAWLQAQSGSEPALGGVVLLGLAVWWTLPQARGNPWR